MTKVNMTTNCSVYCELVELVWMPAGARGQEEQGGRKGGRKRRKEEGREREGER